MHKISQFSLDKKYGLHYHALQLKSNRRKVRAERLGLTRALVLSDKEDRLLTHSTCRKARVGFFMLEKSQESAGFKCAFEGGATKVPSAPVDKRTIAFIDGQNLFRAVKKCFGRTYPDYDVLALATAVCASRGWRLTETRFYTGIYKPADHPFWNSFWQKKLLVMSRSGVKTYSRNVVFRTDTIRLPDGTKHAFTYAQEKGIDVRLALDALRLAYQQEFDVALIFSQDQDLSEVAADIRALAREQSRWVEVASAYPCNGAEKTYGIGKTVHIKFDHQLYMKCIDPRDYRNKVKS